jgi:hypothetical protein
MGRPLAALAALAALLVATTFTTPVLASDAQSVRIERSIDGRALVVSADVEPPRSARLEEAVTRGVALVFSLEFELFRPRWYWWDQRVAQHSVALRLSHHALAREFRVVREDGKALTFDSLDSALAALAQVRNWRIDFPDPPAAGDYLAQIRLRLDTSHLPRPFQVDALTNREWNPQVEWTRSSLTLPSIAKSAP